MMSSGMLIGALDRLDWVDDDPDTITSLAFPRSARDLATPLHEMEYSQQVREAWLDWLKIAQQGPETEV